MALNLAQIASTPSGARRLRLITAISELTVRPGFAVPTDALAEVDAYYGQDDRALEADLRWMKDRGWVEFWASIAGIKDVLIEAAGYDAASVFIESRTDIVERSKSARENYLRWLYDCDHNDDRRLTHSDFRASAHGNYLGQEFSDGEIRKAARRLVDGGYITGERMATGSYAAPRISNEGINIIERYGSLAKIPAASQGNVTTHINLADSHGNNLNVGGSKVTQTSNVTVDQLEQATMFIRSAKGLIPLLGLADGDQVKALEIIGELESETTGPAPKRDRIKELISKVAEIAALGTAQGMVDALVGMAESTLAALGG